MRKRKGAHWAAVLPIVLLAASTADSQRLAHRETQAADGAALKTDRKALAELLESRSELHKAAIRSDREALKALLQTGADPNAADAAGRTPLHSAITSAGRPGNTTAYGNVKALLQYGADPSRKDSNGITPLTKAVVSGSEALVETLLAGGADPNQITRAGVSALALAEMLGNAGAAAAIREAGGVYGSSPHELAIVEYLPQLGKFSKDVQMQARSISRKGDQPTPQEIEDQTVSAWKRHFDFDDDAPEVAEFRRKIREKLSGEECAICGE